MRNWTSGQYVVIAAWGAFVWWALSHSVSGRDWWIGGFVREITGLTFRFGYGYFDDVLGNKHMDALLSGGLIAVVTAAFINKVRARP